MREKDLRRQTEVGFGDSSPKNPEERTGGFGGARMRDPFKNLIGRRITLSDGTTAIAYDLGQSGALPAFDKKDPMANYRRGSSR